MVQVGFGATGPNPSIADGCSSGQNEWRAKKTWDGT